MSLFRNKTPIPFLPPLVPQFTALPFFLLYRLQGIFLLLFLHLTQLLPVCFNCVLAPVSCLWSWIFSIVLFFLFCFLQDFMLVTDWIVLLFILYIHHHEIELESWLIWLVSFVGWVLKRSLNIHGDLNLIRYLNVKYCCLFQLGFQSSPYWIFSFFLHDIDWFYAFEERSFFCQFIIPC